MSFLNIMVKTQSIAKITSIALLTVFVALITPNSMYENTPQTTELAVYGMLEMVQRDSLGNDVFSQSIHNQLTNQGEEYLIDQVFNTGVAGASTANTRIGAICIVESADPTDFDDTTKREGVTAANLGANQTLQAGTSGNHCLVDTTGAVDDDTTSTAIIGPLTFLSGANLVSGETIHLIGICAANGGTNNYTDCDDATGGVAAAFAVVDTADVTLTGTDTVDITYTFDIISATT